MIVSPEPAEFCTLNYPPEWCSVQAIQKAAYRRSAVLTADIESISPAICIKLNGRSGIRHETFIRAVEEFKIDLVDEALRERLKSETDQIRQILLSAAFSRTSLHSSD